MMLVEFCDLRAGNSINILLYDKDLLIRLKCLEIEC